MPETKGKNKTERRGKCFWKSEPNTAASPQIIPESGLKEPPGKTREKLDYNWPVSTGFWPFIWIIWSKNKGNLILENEQRVRCRLTPPANIAQVEKPEGSWSSKMFCCHHNGRDYNLFITGVGDDVSALGNLSPFVSWSWWNHDERKTILLSPENKC